MVTVRRTADERLKAKANIARHYTIEELATLWKYALPSERMLICLGLNFGFVYSEIRTVTADDLQQTETVALRGKTEVLGRWPVWQETRTLAKTEFDKIPAKRQDIANRWTRLLDRVTKDLPTFKRLSFKWIRKSGSSFIRKMGDGELASLYISHGEGSSTDDDLLEIYATARWDDLANVLNRFHEALQPMFTQQTTTARTYIPLTKIDRIRQLWADGVKPEEIATLTGTSRATAYRYRAA